MPVGLGEGWLVDEGGGGLGECEGEENGGGEGHTFVDIWEVGAEA